MNLQPPVFEAKLLLQSTNKPSQYRKDNLQQEIVTATSRYFPRHHKFLVACVRLELQDTKAHLLRLYVFCYDKLRPEMYTFTHDLPPQLLDTELFLQFSDSGASVVVFSSAGVYCVVDVLPPPTSKQDVVELPPSSAIPVLHAVKDLAKLKGLVVSFLLWSSKETDIGIVTYRDERVVFFDLASGTLLRRIAGGSNNKIQTAFLCLEDSNVNKVSTFLVTVSEEFKDTTTVRCQQLAINSVHSSEYIDIFSKGISGYLSDFVIRERGKVQLHFFNNKTCIGFFHKMSLSLYSLYNQRLFYFDVCQSFPKSSVCFLNNKFLFQFSRLPDEQHICGITPLMSLNDKIPQTQVINFGVDSNLFNIRGIAPFYSQFVHDQPAKSSRNTVDFLFDGCVFWNSYCLAIISQPKPQETVYCRKFLAARSDEEEQQVVTFFSTIQVVDLYIQQICSFFLDIREVEKAKRIVKLNKTVSTKLIRQELDNLDYSLHDFEDLQQDLRLFITNTSKNVDVAPYKQILAIVILAKVLKFHIEQDQSLLSLLNAASLEEVRFIVKILLTLQSSAYQRYLIHAFHRYTVLIPLYVDLVNRTGMVFVDFSAMLDCSLADLACTFTCRPIVATFGSSLLTRLFKHALTVDPSLEKLQIFHENLVRVAPSEIVPLLSFLSADGPLSTSAFPAVYALPFRRELGLLRAKLKILDYSNRVRQAPVNESFQNTRELTLGIRNFDIINIRHIFVFARNLDLFLLCSYLLCLCGDFAQAATFAARFLEQKHVPPTSADDVTKMVAEVQLMFPTFSEHIEAEFRQRAPRDNQTASS